MHVMVFIWVLLAIALKSSKACDTQPICSQALMETLHMMRCTWMLRTIMLKSSKAIDHHPPSQALMA